MTAPPVVLRTGEAVAITVARRTVRGTILFASRDARSLMLSFEAILGGYKGSMPVLWSEPRAAYVDLIKNQEVVVTRYPCEDS